MAGATQSIGGLISGLDTNSIIDQLMTIEKKPITKLENKITEQKTKLEAYRAVNNLLLEFQSSVEKVNDDDLWNSFQAVSSNSASLAATTNSYATAGSYSFRVGQLAQTAQYMAKGFTNKDSTAVSPTTSGFISIDSKAASLNRDLDVSELNGGNGIYHGSIKITDKSGQSEVIDLSTAASVQDVIDSINNSGYVGVRASLGTTGLVITDTTGGAGTLEVKDQGQGTTATDLGIVGTAAGAATTITGTNICGLSGRSQLSSLRDGQGVNNGTGGFMLIQDTSLENKASAYSALETLNGGAGVNTANGGADYIYVDDDSLGAPVQVNLQGATRLGDVVDRINVALVSYNPSTTLRARIDPAGTGLGFMNASNLAVTSGVGSTTAEDLGLDAASLSGTTGDISGGDLRPGGIAVDLSAATPVQDVLDSVNSAIAAHDPASTLKMEVDAAGTGLGFANATNLTVSDSLMSDPNNSTVKDLGLADLTGVSGDVAGHALVANLNSVQIASLSGVNGTGLNGARGDFNQTLGSFTVTRLSDSATFNFDLSALTGADSLSTALASLNTQAASAGLALTFGINAAGNGIQVKNTGATKFSFADNVGTLATDLGLAGKTVNANATLSGGDLDLNYLSRASALKDLNNGKGVAAGSIKISNSLGGETTVDLSTAVSLGDVIDRINAAGLAGISARINDTGDGLAIDDTSGGTIETTIEEVDGGSTAADLSLLASQLGGVDGSFERTVTVDTDDTLTDVMNKLADSGARIQTSIINDGSSNPYRLVVASRDSGAAGDFLLDTDLSLFGFSQNSQGQDAILLYGQGGGSVSPVMLKSSTNTNNAAVLGLSLNLQQTSSTYTTITVSQDKEDIATAVGDMVKAYNTIHDLVAQLDTYETSDDSTDSSTAGTAGLLFGDTAVRNLMSSLSDLFFTYAENQNGGIMSFYDLGVTWSDEGDLQLDDATLQSALDYSFENVKTLLYSTRDAADSSHGASATSSAGSTGGNNTKVENLINGNTNSKDFGAGNGYEAATAMGTSGTTVTVDLGKAKYLSDITIYQVDSDTMPASQYALKNFLVEYLDASTNKWETLRSVTNNNQTQTTMGFSEPTLVSQIRVTGTATYAADGKFRLTEIAAKEATGLANQMKRTVDEQTDSDTGFFANLETYINSSVEDLQNTIDKANERLEQVQTRYITQFANMESNLATLQSQSDYFSQQMDALSASKK